MKRNGGDLDWNERRNWTENGGRTEAEQRGGRTGKREEKLGTEKGRVHWTGGEEKKKRKNWGEDREKKPRTEKKEKKSQEREKRKDWRKTGKSEPREKAGHAKRKMKKTEEE